MSGVPETTVAPADPRRQAEPIAVDHGNAGGSTRSVRVLVYSDDRSTREQVRLAVGRRPARDIRIEDWVECATADAVIAHADAGGIDLFLLDGEAVPYGGLGLCRQLKHEIYRCPPVVVLTGRPQDAWLAAWSYAEAAVPHPLDPIVLADTVADVARQGTGAAPTG